MKALLRTEDSLPLMIVRLALGIVMLPHGMQKALGLFGGPGFSGTMAMFTSQGMPAALAFLVILGESAGSLGLIVGFLSRIAGFGISCIMLGAIGMVHWQNGFFMNWDGKQAGEGFEYHILALGIALAVLVGGGGRASVDRAIVDSM
jgi:putative oxidoreductase